MEWEGMGKEGEGPTFSLVYATPLMQSSSETLRNLKRNIRMRNWEALGDGKHPPRQGRNNILGECNYCFGTIVTFSASESFTQQSNKQ